MSLMVWLPLNKEGDFKNRGLADVTITNNGATYDNNGKIGGCYSFDSSFIAIQGWVPSSGSSFSFGGWFKSTANIESWEGLISCRSAGGGIGAALFKYKESSSSVRYRFDISSAGNSCSCTHDSSDWHHIFCAYDTKNKYTYIDGELKLTESRGTAVSGLNTTGWTIGAALSANNVTSVGTYFYGDVNDIRIYDHCLSPKEVKEISKGLVLHYPLNELPIRENLLTGNLAYEVRLTSTTRTTNGPMPTLPDASFLLEHKGETLSLSYELYTLGERLVAGSGQSARWGFHTGISKTIDGETYSASYPFNKYVNNSTSTGLRVVEVWTIPSTWVDCKKWNWQPNFNNKPSDPNVTWYARNLKLEFGSSNTAFVSDGTALPIHDCSGYENNGTITGTLTTSTDTPRYDKCTHISSGNYILPTILLPANKYTIAFWLKLDSPLSSNTWTLIINLGSRGIIYYAQSTRLKYETSGILLSVYTDLTKWHHFCFVINGTNTAYCYLDGEQKVSCTSTLTDGSITNFKIGNSEPGLISDVRLYNTALSTEDILELYNTSAFITDNGTLEGYEFVEKENSKIKQNGLVISLNLYEVSNYSDANISYLGSKTYTPVANTNNSCNTLCDIKYNTPGKYIVELDISWTKFTAGTGGTFSLYLQGTVRNVSTGTYAWEGPNNTIIALKSDFSTPASLLTSSSGSYHYKVVVDMSDLSAYDGNSIGVRCNYSNGTGTFTFGNVKVYPFTQGLIEELTKIGSDYITANQLIEI